MWPIIDRSVDVPFVRHRFTIIFIALSVGLSGLVKTVDAQADLPRRGGSGNILRDVGAGIAIGVITPAWIMGQLHTYSRRQSLASEGLDQDKTE